MKNNHNYLRFNNDSIKVEKATNEKILAQHINNYIKVLINFHVIHRWDTSTGANYTRSYSEVQKGIVQSLQNKTLIITTVLVS